MVVEARANGKRLKSKHSEKIGNKTLIEHVLDDILLVATPSDIVAVSSDDPWVISCASQRGLDNIVRDPELFNETVGGVEWMTAIAETYGQWMKASRDCYDKFKIARVFGNTLMFNLMPVREAINALTDAWDGVQICEPAESMLGDLMMGRPLQHCMWANEYEADQLSHNRRPLWVLNNMPCPQWITPNPYEFSDCIHGDMKLMPAPKYSAVHIHNIHDLKLARALYKYGKDSAHKSPVSAQGIGQDDSVCDTAKTNES